MLDRGELGVEAGLSQGSSQSDLSEPRFSHLENGYHDSFHTRL